MARRYELTDEEWEQIKDLFPKENTIKHGRPLKDSRTMLNAMVWLARSGADCPKTKNRLSNCTKNECKNNCKTFEKAEIS